MQSLVLSRRSLVNRYVPMQGKCWKSYALRSLIILPFSRCLPITAVRSPQRSWASSACHALPRWSDGLRQHHCYHVVCLLASSTAWIMYKSIARSWFSYRSFMDVSHIVQVSGSRRSPFPEDSHVTSLAPAPGCFADRRSHNRSRSPRRLLYISSAGIICNSEKRVWLV